MKRGEIWLVALDPTEGHDQRGRRPVLIVSPEAFNRVTKVPVVVPITSGGNSARGCGFRRAINGNRNSVDGRRPMRSAKSARSRRSWRKET